MEACEKENEWKKETKDHEYINRKIYRVDRTPVIHSMNL